MLINRDGLLLKQSEAEICVEQAAAAAAANE